MQARYMRGDAPAGEVIAESPTYVGNEFNGRTTANLLVRATDGTLWVCFAQPTTAGDYASYALSGDSPDFVLDEARKLGLAPSP